MMGFYPQPSNVNPIEHFWKHLKKRKVKHNPSGLNNL